MEGITPTLRPEEFDAAAIGALAHLYRGEVYRSTIWRTRLDNTTNWAVLTLGIAFSVTFSSQYSSRSKRRSLVRWRGKRGARRW